MSGNVGRWRATSVLMAACVILVSFGLAPPDPVRAQVAAEPDTCASELEPNDTAAEAQTLVLADCGEAVIVSANASAADDDWYRIEIPVEPATLRDVSVTAATDIQLTLCLHSASGGSRQCHSGANEATLPDLLLEPGPHVLGFGAGGEGAYELRLVPTGEWDPGLEAEPNDSLYTASVMDLEDGISGRSFGRDDLFAAPVSGPAQLWDVEVHGEGVHRLRLQNERRLLAGGSVDPDGGRAVLSDLLLPPGTHHFLVLADGEYELRGTPLGTPAAEAEREPNQDAQLATDLPMGGHRIGRLAGPSDVDVYRFTTAAPEHVTLALEQPPDSDISLGLTTAGTVLVRERALQLGNRLELDLWLPPGDHEVALHPVTPSEQQYRLELRRSDPFAGTIDREPNNRAEQAAPLPDTLVIEGSRDGIDDVDWFALPPRSQPGALSVMVEPASTPVLLMVDGYSVPIATNVEGDLAWTDLPAEVPAFLQVRPSDDYVLTLDADGFAAMAKPPRPDLELTLELPTDVVAAYLPLGQRLEGSLALENIGTVPLELSLDATTSHHGWEARPAEMTVALAPEETRVVPVEIGVAQDAWADVPVRLDIAARSADGGLATTSTQMIAHVGAAPVAPDHGWTLPVELLGGLDVASLALGAEPQDVPGANYRSALHDGITPAGISFSAPFDGQPVDIAVDLAGDDPVPVAGTILNPLSLGGALGHLPREIELLLSTDGADWRSVLREELQPLPRDQAFTLEVSEPATHAMLRIHSLHGPPAGQVSLGEWKVVAQPGVEPTTMPRNIADPVRGGHPVMYQPFGNGLGPGYRMLDPDSTREVLPLREVDAGFEIVIGFAGGRAAQIDGLTWADPDASDAAGRPERLHVAVSLDGPLGPWQDVDAWDLAGSTVDAVASYAFDEPRWARFLRLTGEQPAETGVEAPATIEVLERPTDANYRSVLAEWGTPTTLGPYEWSSEPLPEPAAPDDTVGDTASEAMPLAPEESIAERAEGDDEDWYVIDVPAGDNTLVADVSGSPNVEVALSVLNTDGTPVETWQTRLTGGITRYEAVVDPGSYHLRVIQPPANVAFLFDSSESMGLYFEIVMGGLREHAAGIEPGRESVIVVPFGSGPLIDDWSSDPYEIQAAVTDYRLRGASGTSNAESTLIETLERLRERDGRRAVLVITDAESPTENLTPELWTLMDEVRPMIHALHTNNVYRPFDTRDRLRAWAMSSGGHYETPQSQGDMDRAFDRLAAWLRRPSEYGLTVTTTAVDHPPGRLRVHRPGPTTDTEVAPGVGIEVLLDTSGSMRKFIDGKRRIVVAKTSMRRLLTDTLAEGVPVAVRTFGAKGKSKDARCRTQLALPLAPLDTASAQQFVRKLAAPKKAATPIAEALRQVPNDLAGVDGSRVVVLITDGAESCGGDVEAAIAELRSSGVAVNLNIVGFALDEAELKDEMAAWARSGGGSYFDASSASDLAKAVTTAVSPPFTVYAGTSGSSDGGDAVASGTVGGEPVELPAGTYRVEVLVDPIVTFEAVVVPRGEAVELELLDD